MKRSYQLAIGAAALVIGSALVATRPGPGAEHETQEQAATIAHAKLAAIAQEEAEDAGADAA